MRRRHVAPTTLATLRARRMRALQRRAQVARWGRFFFGSVVADLTGEEALLPLLGLLGLVALAAVGCVCGVQVVAGWLR
jgi:hypothetical protein